MSGEVGGGSCHFPGSLQLELCWMAEIQWEQRFSGTRSSSLERSRLPSPAGHLSRYFCGSSVGRTDCSHTIFPLCEALTCPQPC